MRKTHVRVFALLLTICLIFGLVPSIAPLVSAAGLPKNLETVWDMENLPKDLFAADVAWDMTGTYGGHANNMVDASKAAKKGYNKSTAAAITMKAANWDNGVYLRLNKDSKANCDWYGATQFWFWVDVSEFDNSEIYLDLAIDGVFPELNRTYYIMEGNKLVQKLTAKTWDGAVFGRLGLPVGYKGWVGIELSAFKATFGKVNSVGFGFAPTGDSNDLPLSMYVDQFSIVRGDKSKGALEGTGELFNKNNGTSENKLYTDLTEVHQTVLSYGASGAWWTTGWGTEKFADKVLDLVFTDAGAGLNNYRHNIGGGVLDDRTDAEPMTWSRRALSPLTPDGKYDEDRDIGAYTVLMKLKDMGTIDDFTLFINSPPSTMTKSGMTYGDPWADTPSNLREDCYEAFASYVVDMVQLYNWCGVPIKYVSPINEPHYTWDSGAQEGCHYTATEAVEILTLVIKELQERSKEDPTIAHVKVSFAESGTWSNKSFVNYMYMQLYNKPELKDKIAHIGAHSYGTNASAKERLAREMKNIQANVQFRQTEYGPAYAQPDFTITSGLDVARVMYEDLTILNVDGWSYWLAAANGLFTDGLVYFNIGSEDLMPSKRLWAMGQYARFTKGAIRVEVDEYGLPKGVKASAYVNVEEGTLVYVILNENKEDTGFSFMGLPAGSKAEVWETSAIRDLENRGTMTADAAYNLPAESITTFVFSDIKYEDVVSRDHPDNPLGTVGDKDFDYSIFYAPAADGNDPTDPSDPSEGNDPTDPSDPSEGNDPTTGTEPSQGNDPNNGGNDQPTSGGNQGNTPTNPGTSDKEEPTGNNPMLVIILIVVALVVVGAAVVVILLKRKNSAEQEPEEE